MEQKALPVDASAVPVIGLGIVLISIPDVIAPSSTLSGLIIAAALILLLRAALTSGRLGLLARKPFVGHS
jgi:hypothetical protein